MRNTSIIAFINMIFVIAFVSVISTFLLFDKMEKERYAEQEQQRYSLIADAFLSGLQFLPNNRDLEKRYKHFNVALIKDPKERLDILQNAKLLYIKNTVFGRVRIYERGKEHYIYVQSLGYNLMLKDLKSRPYKRKIALLLLALFSGILTFIYTILRKKLSPLKELDAEVQKFADGELDLHIKEYGNDEIGKIAATFKKAIHSLKEQMESKNLFMRNMMHELKTPITKGRILAESIDDFEDKQLLIKSFERMNEIITELAQVEKLTSRNITLHPQIVSFDALVERAKKLLLCEGDCIVKEYSNFRITVDPDHFALVLKNLIDNAVKFSPDRKAIIRATPKKIEVLSKGEPLKYPLSYYTEPFSQEEKKNSGFGLGLYIVNSILNIHGAKLGYRHEDGYNIFEIVL
ncbi:MAG: sensor histidine kinase [Sulfurospirillum sp.]|nr:MAG: sensor histidine kinase [Sulfurospirillum sp.]